MRSISVSVCPKRCWRQVAPSPQYRVTSKDTPAKLAARMRSWRVSLLRGRAQPLGTVEAPDERAAEVAAAAQFGLNDEQRKRLVVREE
jgi:hypothetical protein